MKIATEPSRTEAAPRGGTVDHLHQLLRSGILEGGFAPGQRLIEADLTREYGVSRGPLREALRKIAMEGLVDIVPNRGAIVRRMTHKEIADTMIVREALEGLAAGLAAGRIDEHDHRARLEAFVEFAELGLPKSNAQFLKENETLHTMLVEFADNEQLSVLIRQMGLRTFPKRVSKGAADESYRLASSREHAVIAKAVLSGDAEKAQAAMRKHLQSAQKRIRALMP